MTDRPATQIKGLAEEAIRALDYNDRQSRAIVADNLVAIAKLASDMDARTGRPDPLLRRIWRRIGRR